MSPVKVVTMAVIASALVSAGVSLSFNQSTETDSLDASAADQLNSIQRKLELLDQDLQEIREGMVTKDELKQSQRGLLRRESLAGIEEQINDLQNRRLPAIDDIKKDGTSSTEDVVAAMVDDRLKKAAETARRAKETKREKAFIEWARDNARERTSQWTRKLSLTTDQSDRFGNAMEQHAVTTGPLWGTIKDDRASAQDRLDAISTMRNSARTMMDEMRNILSADQFNRFQTAQQTENEKTNTWFRNLEENLINGGGGGK